MSKTLNDWSKEIYEWAERKGWNKDIVLERELMNFHSEISEAWEEVRKGDIGKHDGCYFPNSDYMNVVEKISDPSVMQAAREGCKPEGFVIEIADLMIRILHSAAYHGWDLERAMQVKMAYNETREYRHGNKIA